MTLCADNPSRPFAVFVTYNPAPAFLGNLEAVREQGAEVVVVDNASGAVGQALLGALEGRERVRILRNPQNLGIAAALNAGVREALGARAGWIFTFDQDSRVPPGFVGAMIAAHAAARREFGRVGVLAPRYVDRNSGASGSEGPGGAGGLLELEATITSGNLIEAGVFEEVGPFLEEFFIDYVDIEFHLRCRRHGLKVVQASGVVLDHSLGSQRRARILWKSFVVTSHSHLRRYYIARNRVRTYRKYLLAEPAWALKDALAFVREIVVIALFEREAGRKLAYTLAGLRDGLRGRMGPLPSRPLRKSTMARPSLGGSDARAGEAEVF